jgi:hypothetical protein
MRISHITGARTHLMEIFQRLDTVEGSGCGVPELSEEEFVEGMYQEFGSYEGYGDEEDGGEDDDRFSREELAKIFRYLDVDQSGHVNVIEFASALSKVAAPVLPNGTPRAASPSVAEEHKFQPRQEAATALVTSGMASSTTASKPDMPGASECSIEVKPLAFESVNEALVATSKSASTMCPKSHGEIATDVRTTHTVVDTKSSNSTKTMKLNQLATASTTNFTSAHSEMVTDMEWTGTQTDVATKGLARSLQENKRKKSIQSRKRVTTIIADESVGKLGLIFDRMPPAEFLIVSKVLVGTWADHQFQGGDEVCEVGGKKVAKLDAAKFKELLKVRPLSFKYQRSSLRRDTE